LHTSSARRAQTWGERRREAPGWGAAPFRAIEASLEALGVPFAHVGGEDEGDALGSARWILCASSGGLSKTLFEHLVAAKERGAAVTLGPRVPELGGARRVLQKPFDFERLAGGTTVPLHLTSDPRAIDAAVTCAVRELGLPTWSSDPDGVHVTVHEDAEGRPRVLFVIQPDGRDRQARIALGAGVKRAIDLLGDEVTGVSGGVLELRVPPRSGRMQLLED